MASPERDPLTFYEDPSDGGLDSLRAGWPVLAVMAIGVLLVAANLLGLIAGTDIHTFGAAGGNGAAGVQLVGLVLGAGLVMRNELARRVYLVFAVIGLVLTLLDSSSYDGSRVSYVLGLLIDTGTVALLLHPKVRRAFD
jgi:hypothetical protein